MAWKTIGETPLACMHRTLREHGFPESTKACYCGRLDPMAQGVSVFLIGEALTKENIAHWNSCRKTYRFYAVLGIKTDSYDCLGRIKGITCVSHDDAEQYNRAIMALSGQELWQEFPPLSAYRYKGRPLWARALDGTLPHPMPGAMRKVTRITKTEESRIMALAEFRAMVLDDISQLHSPGDFNASVISEDWLALQAHSSVYLLAYEAEVSSGTYIRGLVAEIGCKLGIPAHAWRITRLAINPPSS
jgi:tRNA pseudouridine(55) synthase